MWISPRASKEMKNFSFKKENPKGQLLKKLERYSKNGFAGYTGSNKPVRPEIGYDGVFRIGHRDSLFRLAGFFEGNGHDHFLIMDAYMKSGQSLSASERARLSRIAETRAKGCWIKKGAA
ncbi:MAG: hypothetical protein AAF916_00090 [Planctomycetota bacterium]